MRSTGSLLAGSSTARTAARLVTAGCCGVATAAATRVFAGATCTVTDPPGVHSTCTSLVNSLSVRLGAVIALVALLACLMGSALMRTAEELEQRRASMQADQPGSPTRNAPEGAR